MQLLPQQFLKKSRDPDPPVPIGANVLVTLQLFVKIEVSRFYRLERRSQNLKIRLLGYFVIFREKFHGNCKESRFGYFFVKIHANYR